MATKHKKIVGDIETQIANETLYKGDQLPSLADIRATYGVSRDTGIRAYKDLTKRGIVSAVHGKGYFVAKSKTDLEINLFLLLDEFTSYKEVLVRAIAEKLNGCGEYQIFFHHYNPGLFESLVLESIGKFTHYAISPFPKNDVVSNCLTRIPHHQLILLDRHDGQNQNFNFVGQEYNLDVFNGLKEIKDRINKYNRLKFIFPEPSYHPEGLKNGFRKFCVRFDVPYRIYPKLSIKKIKKGDAFLIISDDDLTEIVKYCYKMQWKLGDDIGIVSYNETQLKSVVANGITTISTDFKQMGERLVKVIKENLTGQVHNTSKVWVRKSI